MMGFRHFVKKYVGEGMMVKMFQDGILKLNHLLLNELFKRRKTHKLGAIEGHMPP